MTSSFGNRKRERISNIVGGCFAVPALAFWLYAMSFYECGQTTRDDANGKIYPLKNHGTLRYHTKSELTEMKSCEFAALGCAVVAGVIGVFSRKNYRTDPVALTPNKKTYLLHSELQEQEHRRNS